MAQVPIAISSNVMVIPVNLSSMSKTFTLPVVSTNQGRMLIFKDYYGNSANSTIRLSTIGLDRIERSGVSSMALSQTFGAWTFMNDGATKWFLTDVYQNTLPIEIMTSYLPGLWTRFYNLTGDPSINGPGNSGWGNLIGTSGVYNPINFQDGDSRIGQSDQVGIISKGYMYSPTTTVVTFRTVSDDGIVVYFNGTAVLQNWTYHGDTQDNSASVTLPAGYTPIEMRFFEWGGGFTCELYWSIGSTGTFVSNTTGVMFYDKKSLT